MNNEYCDDCKHGFQKGQMRIHCPDGKVRCEKCDAKTRGNEK